MARRILITGGTGYLGSELVRLALEQRWEVMATYFSRQQAEETAQHVSLDIRDEAAVVRLLEEFRPDAIIHTAFRQDGPDLWATTAEGAGLIARAARRVAARLIHLSSDVIFDGERAGRYQEQDRPAPITPYGEAKAAAERLVMEYAPRALIARTSLIYGGSVPSKHERLVLDVADGRIAISFFLDELRCPIAVGDLAHALLELAPTRLSGPLHLAGADVVSRYDFARMVAAAHGRSPDRIRSALSAESGVRRPRNCALDSSRAQSLLRTQLRGVREVLGQ
jgi:dTDP-4-dehydrorhamnose reductase